MVAHAVPRLPVAEKTFARRKTESGPAERYSVLPDDIEVEQPAERGRILDPAADPLGIASRDNFLRLRNSVTGEDLAPLMTDYLDTLMR